MKSRNIKKGEYKTMIFGILSLNVFQIDNNWGSVLQSWALQQQLNKMNIQNQIVCYRPQIINKNYAKYPILKTKFRTFFKYLPIYLCNAKSFVIRDQKFQAFYSKHYIKTPVCDSKSISTLPFDGYIIGSDIVWNEQFWKGIEPAYFCEIDSMKKKRLLNMAYAPSLSTNGFSPSLEKRLPSLLDNFNYISVREKRFVPYLQRFTHKKVHCVLDPTLLLDQNEYEPLVAPRLIREKYVLVYCVSQNKDLLHLAMSFCKSKGLKLVTIKCTMGRKMFLGKNCISFDEAGVEEWLSLIKYAEIILTTSFHASIFSILFKKKFYVITNPFSESKITDLVEELGLNNRLMTINNNSNFINFESPIDYNFVFQKLSVLRKQSLDFISKGLHKVNP